MSRAKDICTFHHHRPLLPVLLILIGLVGVIGDEQKKHYIAFLGDNLGNTDSTVQAHVNLLSSVKGSSLDAKESIVYSYANSFNAFAAKLTPDEAQNLSRMKGVLLVIPNRYHKLHTTRSWDFIGLPITARRNLRMESDIVVGLLDTGITPGSESFKDHGFGPPPAKWKGTCGHFAGCNNKLIGARYFKLDGQPDPADILSPLDKQGHGTHTSSTAVGNLVGNASLFGFANGTARGAVPSARVAMYKVCWASFGCSDMDILAGFDAAIKDGVDVISVSIGGGFENYTTDAISIASFHAMKKGIITVASAGNDGPTMGTLSNHAPWLLTVAASGIDREFRTEVRLGNGQSFLGVGVNNFRPKMALYPLVSGADIPINSSQSQDARYCVDGSLDPAKVKGRIVYCEIILWGTDSYIKRLHGAGTLISSDQYFDSAQIFMAPGTEVNSTMGDMINKYIHSTRVPRGVIYRTQQKKRAIAPFIASFSSRGPSPSHRLLKPDIAAPGNEILAAYTPLQSVTGLPGDTQYSKFVILSGTSMACPHVAGVAAYVKSFHPTWSPAAIKSAILTTAKPMSRRLIREAEFAFGAGQLNPTRAVNPGLVYDMGELPYIQFLCQEGYPGPSLAPLVGSTSINCSNLLPGFGYDNLNYPSIQLGLTNKLRATTVVFRRIVTNVGHAVSTYNATIRAPRGVEITVSPMSLSFSRVLQKQSFKVVVKAPPMSSMTMVSGSLIWKSLHYVVRSPIVIYSP